VVVFPEGTRSTTNALRPVEASVFPQAPVS
jgi:1-acyl-sn-glycerol-3-phosphate acyltransferase